MDSQRRLSNVGPVSLSNHDEHDDNNVRDLHIFNNENCSFARLAPGVFIFCFGIYDTKSCDWSYKDKTTALDSK